MCCFRKVSTNPYLECVFEMMFKMAPKTPPPIKHLFDTFDVLAVQYAAGLATETAEAWKRNWCVKMIFEINMFNLFVLSVFTRSFYVDYSKITHTQTQNVEHKLRTTNLIVLRLRALEVLRFKMFSNSIWALYFEPFWSGSVFLFLLFFFFFFFFFSSKTGLLHYFLI